MHEFEPVPVKFQQTAVSSEMPSVQGAVVIAPERLRPTSVAPPPVRPKPTIVPVTPGAGGVSASGAGAMPVTGVVSLMTARSARGN